MTEGVPAPNRFCMYDRHPQCAMVVGALYDKEQEIQDAATLAEFAEGADRPVDSATAELAGRYEAVHNNSYAREILGLAAMMLPGGQPCSDTVCPIAVDIALRNQLGPGDPNRRPHYPGE